MIGVRAAFCTGSVGLARGETFPSTKNISTSNSINIKYRSKSYTITSFIILSLCSFPPTDNAAKMLVELKSYIYNFLDATSVYFIVWKTLESTPGRICIFNTFCSWYSACNQTYSFSLKAMVNCVGNQIWHQINFGIVIFWTVKRPNYPLQFFLTIVPLMNPRTIRLLWLLLMNCRQKMCSVILKWCIYTHISRKTINGFS